LPPTPFNLQEYKYLSALFLLYSFPNPITLPLSLSVTMATKEALEALEKTDLALQDIRTKLQPFLAALENHAENTSSNNNNNKSNKPTATAPATAPLSLALSQTAVALSLGTLRYMGARLRGLDQGRSADDPLRKELNHMRKLLVTLSKKQKQAPKAKVVQPKETAVAAASPKSGTKRKGESSASSPAASTSSKNKPPKDDEKKEEGSASKRSRRTKR
jgi:hypothetical protein